MTPAEPATPDQIDCLKHLNVPCDEPMSRSFADCAIRYYGATDEQLACLFRLGIRVDPPITRQEAHRLISHSVSQRRQLPPTDKQKYVLKRHGKWRDDLTQGQAWDLIHEIRAGQNRYQ